MKLFKQYHLVCAQFGGTFVNVVIDVTPIEWLARNNQNGAVVRNIWRISRKDYLKFRKVVDERKRAGA